MMLAVATSAPRIIFISEEGAVVPNFEIARKKCAVSSLKWHPLMQALAIGWEDGFMTLWNEDERLTRDDKTVHHSAVTNITFSTDGSRMVTGDVKGTCAVWRTHKGMTPLC
jgi:intraflagellar transport protein 140